MKNLLIVFLVAGRFCSAFTKGIKSSTVGRTFVFGIFEMVDNCCHDSRNKIALDITNTSPNRTRVRIQIPFLNNDTSVYISPGTKETYLIDPSIQRDGTFKDSRGIRVTSDQDISVLVTNAFNSGDTIDSYNILPVTEIGNDYNISSYKTNYDTRGSEILVAASSNNTTVTLKNGSSVIQSIVLNEFDTFQYLCKRCDLTGINIGSNKKLYVVSGSTYAKIPPSGSYDYIASEMFPITAWSSRYIIPPVLPKSAFMIRIISRSSDNVTLANRTRTYALKHSTEDQYFGTEAVVAMAKRPFSVTQYGVSYDYGNLIGDPFMAVVPGIDQYINEYIFTVPRGYYGVKYHAAIIVPAIGISDLVLDGRSLLSFNTTKVSVPPPLDYYTIFTFSINEGYHHFTHPNPIIKYGVFIYGHGHDLSSGFYAGYDLKALVDSKHMCYSCEDLSHVDLCDTVKQCNNAEVCYVEQYEYSGKIKYKSGCFQQQTCASKQYDSKFDDICFECCDGDYCNNKGCGENGIPDRGHRGPICFDCQHVSSPDECVNITPCDIHQVCRIEEYKWFDHSHFKLGCGHGLCDPVKRSNVVKRATPVCQSCCNEDYCNSNCTSTSQSLSPAVIVG